MIGYYTEHAGRELKSTVPARATDEKLKIAATNENLMLICFFFLEWGSVLICVGSWRQLLPTRRNSNEMQDAITHDLNKN
jgi:hypothetical protein